MELLCLHTGFFNPSENTPEWNSCAYILVFLIPLRILMNGTLVLTYWHQFFIW
jgi:hypothetical protein